MFKIKRPKSAVCSISKAIDEIGGVRKNDRTPANTISDDEIIYVRSITFGSVIYTARSDGRTFIWEDIGAVVPMSAARITEMNLRSPDFLRKPLLILEDERAAAHFGLETLYDSIAMLSETDQAVCKGTKAASQLIDRALAANMRELLITRVRSLYNSGKLKDIDVIRLLERRLCFDLAREDENADNV